MVFFQKEFDPDEKLGKEDIEEIRVILGIWPRKNMLISEYRHVLRTKMLAFPVDNVVRQECQKMFYSVKSKEAPTSAHLAKLAATVSCVRCVLSAQALFESVLIVFC